jgi:FKBP-type peptidyl-prolyl cis-trans isomerase
LNLIILIHAFAWENPINKIGNVNSHNLLVYNTKEAYQKPFVDALKVCAISFSTFNLGMKIAVAATPKKPKVLETDLGIQYIILNKGSGPYPNPGDFIVIDYIGFLKNGTVFDSTEVKGRKPLSFRFGKKQIIPGIESVLEYLQPGGEATCVIPPQFAYGSKGVCLEEGKECIVPPNETLKYVLKLKSVGAGYN